MLPDDPKANIDPDIDLLDDEVEEESSLPAIDEPAEPAAGPLASGVAAIQRYAKLAPKAPGVYRMIDAKGEVLYVGKAKSIRKRIVSYAREAGHTARIARMIAATASIEFVSTATETEALLLEANLIKRLRPRFNELVREAKSFLSGKSRAVKDELAGEMEKASGTLDFERAAVYRDRLAALSAIQARQGVNPRNVEEADVFAVHQQAGYSCVEVFFF